MADRNTRFILKRSNVQGKIPTLGQLQLGELALNTADAKAYTPYTGGLSGATEVRQIGWDRLSTISGGTVNGDILMGNGTIIYSPNFSGGTFFGDGSNLTGITDTFITGGTYSNNNLTLNRNDGQNITITGLTNERQILDVYQTGTTSVGSTFTDINFDSQIIVDSNYLFTGGTIEFNSTGYYEVDYSISLDVSSGGRKTARHRLVLDEGSGFNEIVRSVSFSYHRNNSSGKGSASKKIRQLFNAGDVIKLQSEIESGGGSLISIANASNITINKISS